MAERTMQGLTPTITVTVGTSTDLTEAGNVYVSFKQGGKVWKKTDGTRCRTWDGDPAAFNL